MSLAPFSPIWELSGLHVCPNKILSQSSETPSRNVKLDEASLSYCKQGPVLKACVSFYMDLPTKFCRVKQAGLILSLFWSILAALILTSGCIYCVARFGVRGYNPHQADDKYLPCLLTYDITGIEHSSESRWPGGLVHYLGLLCSGLTMPPMSR